MMNGLYGKPTLICCGRRSESDCHRRRGYPHPTVIIEVLSPSTEVYDRGRKFSHDRRLDSLKSYVLVAQDKPCVERYTRQGEDWLLTDLNPIDDVLQLVSIDCGRLCARSTPG